MCALPKCVHRLIITYDVLSKSKEIDKKKNEALIFSHNSRLPKANCFFFLLSVLPFWIESNSICSFAGFHFYLLLAVLLHFICLNSKIVLSNRGTEMSFSMAWHGTHTTTHTNEEKIIILFTKSISFLFRMNGKRIDLTGNRV